MLRNLTACQVRRHTTVAFKNIWCPKTKVITHPYSEGGPQAWVLKLWSQERIGLMELDPTVFSIRPRFDIMYEVNQWHKNCLFHGAFSSRRRSDLPSSGKKLAGQKGSGRARVGNATAPHRKTGRGVDSHGAKPYDPSTKMNLKVRRLAMRSALSVRYMQDALVIVDELTMPKISTRMFSILKTSYGWKNVLFVRDEPSWKSYLDGKYDDVYKKNWDIFMETANQIKGVTCVTMNEMTTHDVMSANMLVMTASVARALEEQLHY